MKKLPPTLGQVLLRKVCDVGTVTDVATKLGITREYLHKILKSAAKPGYEIRMAAMAVCGIQPGDWDVPAIAEGAIPIPQAPKAPLEVRVPAKPANDSRPAKDRMLDQMNNLRAYADQLRADGEPARDVLAAENYYSAAVAKFASLAGETTITEATILRSEPWKRLARITFDILRDHPAILKKLVTAWETASEDGERAE